LENTRGTIKRFRGRSDYLELQIRELERLLESVEPGREHELRGLYQRFFVDKQLEGAIEHKQGEDKSREEAKKTEVKIG
jgi:hypothetical protein